MCIRDRVTCDLTAIVLQNTAQYFRQGAFAAAADSAHSDEGTLGNVQLNIL